MPKLKTKEEMLEWFGARHIPVKEVLERTDNRRFRKLYITDKVFGFDAIKREYFVN